MPREKEQEKEDVLPDWRDYVAIVAASFETTLLPILAIAAALILIALILSLMHGP
jgi:hypothetical protein